MTTLIDRNSPIPLYYQLKQILLSKIEGAEYVAGDLIPSEQNLQETYGLSRTTVRQTLSEMVFEGRLIRQRGKGTFIADSKFTHDPSQRLGLRDTMLEQGTTPGWVVLDKDWIDAPDKVGQALELNENERAFRIRRIRLANDEPIGIHTTYLSASAMGYINEGMLESGDSLAYLEKHPQMNKPGIKRTLEAAGANENEAEKLNIEENSPVLLIERITRGADDKPIEFLKAAYRGDRFKYQITI